MEEPRSLAPPSFPPIGPLPPGCPRAEDVFSPELLARYNPQVVKYVLASMAPGMPPATHQVELSVVRAHPSTFRAPWQKDASAFERVAAAQFVSEDGVEIPVQVYHPDPARFGNGPYGVHLNFHGGGFVFGDLTTESSLCLSMRDGAGVVVVDVNYRHCPEAQFGKCFQDGWAALHWVRDSASELNIDPESVSVGGISAGAHISIVLQHLARDGGIPLRLCMATVPPTSGWMGYEDYRESPFASFREFALGPVLSWERLQYLGRTCLPFTVERREEEGYADLPCPAWQVSPLEAANWSGLCPALIRTAEVDPLRDEGEAYGKKLLENGNKVTMKRYLGCPHMFPYYQWLPEKQEFDRESIAALKEAHRSQERPIAM
ncbi:alpha/beta-hydrolase [Xylariaceae sp. FL0594]|nr:alpha/beta-hydrolase [Xylariaceae sp. FL0594]